MITRDPGGNPWARAAVPAFGDVAASAPLTAPGRSIIALLSQTLALDVVLALVIVFGVTAVVLEFRRRRRPV